MKSWILTMSLLIFTAAFGAPNSLMLGPARGQWINRGEIIFKTPVALRGKKEFYLRTSTESVQLRVKKNDWGRVTLGVPSLTSSEIEKLLRADLQIVVIAEDGRKVDQSALQWAGLLDELYAHDQTALGLRWSSNGAKLSVWAPTAREVQVALYRNPSAPKENPDSLLPMTYANGFWNADIPNMWKNQYYLFKVDIFNPRLGGFKTYFVTDPYSVGLSQNSQKSQFIDLEETHHKPRNWSQFSKPALNEFTDISIYEVHLRDLTAGDTSLPESLRGTYKAFSQSGSKGVQYLKSLAQAGLTHIHFLPLTDFATVNEDKQTWLNIPLQTGIWNDSTQPQSELEKIRTEDSYNWGYDPVHWFAPEGSYATSANTRVQEMRQMIVELNTLGLRVVMDMVFNHTYADQEHRFSVLDLLVPFYYYRYDEEGRAMNTSCCPDTASETRMMERMMVDSVLFWAKAYKIDGFRFDLMSFHSRETMRKIRERLDSLTLSRDGVDGRKIYVYGEGWEFGSFVNKNPHEAMTQRNAYGYDIGLFNDRMRDALRGGTTDSREKSDQGFISGLFYDFNQEPANRNTPVDLATQKEKLFHLQDVIKIGLAGNLRDFSFIDYRGQRLKGGDLHFRGQPVGYAARTAETVNYVSAHDGYSLWDAVQAKAPFFTPGRNPRTASTEERLRMHWLGLSAVLLSQGVAFIEGGSEMLRSKSGDSDSYDSGDWFNTIDWSMKTNNWGAGLPPAWRNRDDWSFWSPRLQEISLRVSHHDITKTQEYFKALLSVRKRLRAFQFQTAVEMMMHAEFLENRRQGQVGVIAFLLKKDQRQKLILINTAPNQIAFEHPIFMAHTWKPAPELVAADPKLKRLSVVKSTEFKIPGRSTVVLETP